MSQNAKSHTFVVQVAYQQNATWQGTIKWMDQGKVAHFRSALELVNMMDEAIKTNMVEPEAED